MARDFEVIDVPQGAIVELTSGTASRVTFAVLEGAVELIPSDAMPDQSARGIPWEEGHGAIDRPLSEFRAAGPGKLFAKGRAHPKSKVLIDHA